MNTEGRPETLYDEPVAMVVVPMATSSVLSEAGPRKTGFQLIVTTRSGGCYAISSVEDTGWQALDPIPGSRIDVYLRSRAGESLE